MPTLATSPGTRVLRAARQEHQEKDQDAAEQQRPPFQQRARPLEDEAHHRQSEDRPPEGRAAADNDPDDQIDHCRDIEVLRVDGAEAVRQQRTGDAGEERSGGECQGPVMRHVDADAFRKLGIGIDRLEGLADARLIDNRLFLISCSGETSELPMDQHQGLRKIPKPDRDGFVIAPDGAYIHWPKPDVHLDLEDTRFFLDPVEREGVKARKAQTNARFAEAMASFRRQRRLRQADIPGLSERQVRRYEHGTHVPLASLRLLATGHGMELSDYLDELAQEADSRE